MDVTTYVSWEQEITMKKYSTTQWLLCVFNEASTPEEYMINDTAAEIISQFNGQKTVEEVISFLSEKYQESTDSISEKVNSFVYILKTQYGLSLSAHSEPVIKPVIVEKSYPRICSLEITNMCNIKCLHCYGNYGAPEKHNYFTLDQAKNVLDQLVDIGVDIVELTGGDVTVHPNFENILDYALSLEFKRVIILTNGILVNERIAQIAEAHLDKIIFQIDLQSLNDDYLAWFTSRKNTLEKIQNNICMLTSKKIKVRAVTMATLRNLEQIPDIADWAYNHGVMQYAVSTVVSLGRAVSSRNAELYISEIKDAERFSVILQQIIEKYPGFMRLNIDGQNIRHNCGCISSHVVIDSTGNIKLCTMDTLQYFNSSIGNVLEKSIKDIYDQNSEFVSSFADMKAPNKDSNECVECKNKNFCNGCVLRGLISGPTVENCKWIATIPDIVKKRFFNT